MSPSALSAADASAYVVPVRSPIGRGAGPEDTVRSTAVPFGSVLFRGDQSSTRPLVAFSSGLGVTVPTFRSAACSAAVAAP